MLSPDGARREQQCCLQPPHCSHGCEGDALYNAIKQCLVSYRTNCKEIVRAAESHGPSRPSCKVMARNRGEEAGPATPRAASCPRKQPRLPQGCHVQVFLHRRAPIKAAPECRERSWCSVNRKKRSQRRVKWLPVQTCGICCLEVPWHTRAVCRGSSRLNDRSRRCSR